MAPVTLSLDGALAERLAAALERLEALLPMVPASPDWERFRAFRWRRLGQRGHLQAVRHPHRLRLADLRRIDRQKAVLDLNVRQFLAGRPCNNVLLWGARGTGKSSLIKALLTEYAGQGLRLVEVDRQHLAELAEIQDQLHARPERFLLYCDDLSFEADDAGYKALKAVLEGSISAQPGNVLIYATSNRRHLLPEYAEDNQQTRWVNGELHQGEAVEEKISLSERFGVWLSFRPFNQDQYLAIVRHWLDHYGQTGIWDLTRTEALAYALLRGSRSGRVAWQFAKDWAGRQGIREARESLTQ